MLGKKPKEGLFVSSQDSPLVQKQLTRLVEDMKLNSNRDTHSSFYDGAQRNKQTKCCCINLTTVYYSDYSVGSSTAILNSGSLSLVSAPLKRDNLCPLVSKKTKQDHEL